MTFHETKTLSLDVSAFVKNNHPSFEIFHRRGYAMAEVSGVRLLKNGVELASDDHVSSSGMAIFDRSPGVDYVFFSLKHKTQYDLHFDKYEAADYRLEYDVKILPIEQYKEKITIPLGQFLKSEDHRKIENKAGTVRYRSSGVIRVLD